MNAYENTIIIGICWCIGFVMKKWLKKVDDKYIPTALFIIGIGLSIWMNGEVTPEVILSGMVSGLASVGVHQNFKQLIDG